MSDQPILGVHTADAEPPPPQQPSASNPTTAGAAAMANGTPKTFSTDTKVTTTASLKEKAPEVYKKMLEGIAMNIIRTMRRSEERRRQIARNG